MNLKLTGIALCVAFAFATAAQAQTAPDRKAKNAEEERIEQAYKADKDKCDAMKANAKDICMAEAKGKEKVAKAEQKVQDARAEASYEVAKQKCDDQKGEAKDACMKQARVDRDRAKGKAEKTAESRSERPAAGATAKPKQQ
jgi:hypothetical protein